MWSWIAFIGISILLCTCVSFVSFPMVLYFSTGFFSILFPFPFGVMISSRVSSGIVLVHVCFSIPCSYSISLVGTLNELCFSTMGRKDVEVYDCLAIGSNQIGSGAVNYVPTITNVCPILGLRPLS